MSEIISRRTYIEGGIVRRRMFDWEGETDWGYSFDCDETGTPVNLHEGTQESFNRCLANDWKDEHGNPAPIVDKGIQSWKTKGYWEPAILKCDCGERVALRGFTNTCDCGADYNMSGQRLASRAQWGEETGESVSDILSVDSECDYGCP